jgi:hypothetical protein
MTAEAAPKVNLITIIVIKLYNNMTTPASLSVLAYDRFSGAEGELINDKHKNEFYYFQSNKII